MKTTQTTVKLFLFAFYPRRVIRINAGSNQHVEAVMKNCLLALLCLIGLGLSTGAAEIIYVSGDVSGVWSADSVIVTGDVRVPPGQTLQIQPGVQVLFQGSYRLTVENAAVLTAVGTVQDSIRFDRMGYGVHWRGLHFEYASSACLLEYCRILNGEAVGQWPPENCGGGVYCHYSPITVRHCLIAECASQGDGGGICLLQSNAEIRDNAFIGNRASSSGNGGALYCGGSAAIVAGNLFQGNSVEWMHGGAVCLSSALLSTVTGNTFIGNSAVSLGGGGSGGGLGVLSPALISDNVFNGNEAYWMGGGIFIHASEGVVVEGNTISGGSAGVGGGIALDESTNLTVRRNLIYGNTAFTDPWVSGSGGGIYGGDCLGVHVINNTIAANTAQGTGGGYLGGDRVIELRNNILWDNQPNQIVVPIQPSTTVAYCDVQGGWSGTGNINADPQFVNAAGYDYHLTAGSPCIDAGDPVSPPDPDGTRADIGALYFDQGSVPPPVSVALSPVNPPIQIPPSGGSFEFNVAVTNGAQNPQTCQAWILVSLPGGSFYGPVLGPVSLTLPVGMTVSRDRVQNVPAIAPAGVYSYIACVGTYPTVIWDEASFPFTKAGSAGRETSSLGWDNTGEDFPTDESEATGRSADPAPAELAAPPPYDLTAIFSEGTVAELAFTLPYAARVTWEVFDVQGRRIETARSRRMRGEWFEAGAHSVELPSAHLAAAGVYFARLTAIPAQANAAPYTVVKKIISLK
jgi:hypothetical protein